MLERNVNLGRGTESRLLCNVSRVGVLITFFATESLSNCVVIDENMISMHVLFSMLNELISIALYSTFYLLKPSLSPSTI